MNEERRDFFKKAGIITAAGITGACGITGCDSKNQQGNVPTQEPTQLQEPTPAPTPQPKPQAPTFMNGRLPVRRLGLTNLMVSALSFGVMENSMNDVWLIEKAIDEGINYFDTAPDYRWGVTEQALGKAIAGKRDKVIVATKLCRQGTGMMHLPAGISADEIITHVEGSLSRLETDYIDILILHALGENMPGGGYCNGVDCHTNRLNDPNMWEAVDRLKEQGKLRFFGVSAHGNNSFPQSLHDAIETDKVDMMLVAYYYGQGGVIEPVIQHCKEKDVGFISMKTIRRGQLPSDFSSGNSPSQAKIKWALANDGVTSVCKSIHNEQELEEYIRATTLELTSHDLQLIEADYRTIANKCHVGCQDCHASCPYGVPVGNILRYSMYFHEYHNLQKEAMAYYNQIPAHQNASKCVHCQDTPCVKACKHGVDIPKEMLMALQALSMDWRVI